MWYVYVLVSNLKPHFISCAGMLVLVFAVLFAVPLFYSACKSRGVLPTCFQVHLLCMWLACAVGQG